MSNSVAALSPENIPGLVDLEMLDVQGMISLRADLQDKKAGAAIKRATGCALPEMRKVTSHKNISIAWMSPDELLILCDYADADALCEKIGEALSAQHHLVANVSDARANFRLRGAAWRDVLGKIAPIDLDASVMGAGDIRRTRAAQIAAAIWCESDDCARVVCFRSVAEYMRDLLRQGAGEGSAVNWYRG